MVHVLTIQVNHEEPLANGTYKVKNNSRYLVKKEQMVRFTIAAILRPSKLEFYKIKSFTHVKVKRDFYVTFEFGEQLIRRNTSKEDWFRGIKNGTLNVGNGYGINRFKIYNGLRIQYDLPLLTEGEENWLRNLSKPTRAELNEELLKINNRKTRENAVRDFLKAEFDFTWEFDKRISGGWSLCRPDALVYYEDQVIIVEIDEEQHKRYNKSESDERLVKICEDLNMQSVIFIRFNPDAYTTAGVRKESCWTKNSEGRDVIADLAEWNSRLDKLADRIEYWVNKKTDKQIEEEHLFFDD
jgi:hypothetical protein